MIAAIDTEGDRYITLAQTNNNSEFMKMYFYYLANQLNNDRPGWRTNTIVLLDNAAPHISKETRFYIQKLGIPVMLTAPYSYSASPIETFFANFKRGNLNPTNQPSGKK